MMRRQWELLLGWPAEPGAPLRCLAPGCGWSPPVSWWHLTQAPNPTLIIIANIVINIFPEQLRIPSSPSGTNSLLKFLSEGSAANFKHNPHWGHREKTFWNAVEIEVEEDFEMECLEEALQCKMYFYVKKIQKCHLPVQYQYHYYQFFHKIMVFLCCLAPPPSPLCPPPRLRADPGLACRRVLTLESIGSRHLGTIQWSARGGGVWWTGIWWNIDLLLFFYTIQHSIQ